MNNPDKSAYPVHGGYDCDDPRNKIIGGGLSKREMFAMAAMQGLCANSIAGPHRLPGNLAAEAIEYADELLKQLEK